MLSDAVNRTGFDPDSVSVDDAYRALELPQSARRHDIRRAYLRLALAHHPSLPPVIQRLIAFDIDEVDGFGGC